MSTFKAAPAIDWNNHPFMRLAVRSLDEDFPNMSAADRMKIFNAVFATELVECGFEHGIADKE